MKGLTVLNILVLPRLRPRDHRRQTGVGAWHFAGDTSSTGLEAITLTTVSRKIRTHISMLLYDFRYIPSVFFGRNRHKPS